MKRFFFAAALATLLPTSFAMAQDMDSKAMMSNLTMIQSNVGAALTKYGVDADPSTLTVAQLSVIVGLLNEANSGSMSNNNIKSEIEVAIAQH